MPLSNEMKMMLCNTTIDTFDQTVTALPTETLDDLFNKDIEELLLFCMMSNIALVPRLLTKARQPIRPDILNKVLKHLLDQHTMLDLGVFYSEKSDVNDQKPPTRWEYGFIKAGCLLIRCGADINITAGESGKNLLDLLVSHKGKASVHYAFIKELIIHLKSNNTKSSALFTSALQHFISFDPILSFHENARQLSCTTTSDDLAVIVLLLQAGGNPQEPLGTSTPFTLGMFLVEYCRACRTPLMQEYFPLLLRSGCELLPKLHDLEALQYMVTQPDLTSINMGLALLQCPGKNNVDFHFKNSLLSAIGAFAPNIGDFFQSEGISPIFFRNAAYIFEHININKLCLELNSLVKKPKPLDNLALICIYIIEERRNNKEAKSRFASLPFDMLLMMMNHLSQPLQPFAQTLSSQHERVRNLIRVKGGFTIVHRQQINEKPSSFEFYLSVTAYCRHFKPTRVRSPKEALQQENERKQKASQCLNSQLQLFKSAKKYVRLIDSVRNHPAFDGVDLLTM